MSDDPGVHPPAPGGGSRWEGLLVGLVVALSVLLGAWALLVRL